MPPTKRTILNGSGLRRAAEQRVNRENAKSSALPQLPHVRDLHNLVHELQVHKVELELQNEELRRVQEALEASRDMYANLYDFAPGGYFTLGPDGTILGANFRGARLLGLDRPQLVGRRLGSFLAEATRGGFADYLAKIFRGDGPGICEVTIRREEAPPVWLRIEATVSPSREECHAAATDISDLKRAQEALQAASSRPS